MNSTRLISTLFKPRQKATALYATQAEALQHKVFCRLINDAANTEWGLKYGYKDIKRYQDFQRVPIQTYEEIKPYVERMRHGKKISCGVERCSGLLNLRERPMTRANLFP